jgi:hypothetical protein
MRECAGTAGEQPALSSEACAVNAWWDRSGVLRTVGVAQDRPRGQVESVSSSWLARAPRRYLWTRGCGAWLVAEKTGTVLFGQIGVTRLHGAGFQGEKRVWALALGRPCGPSQARLHVPQNPDHAVEIVLGETGQALKKPLFAGASHRWLSARACRPSRRGPVWRPGCRRGRGGGSGTRARRDGDPGTAGPGPAKRSEGAAWRSFPRAVSAASPGSWPETSWTRRGSARQIRRRTAMAARSVAICTGLPARVSQPDLSRHRDAIWVEHRKQRRPADGGQRDRRRGVNDHDPRLVRPSPDPV